MQRVKDGATGVDYYGIANSTDIDLEDEVVVPDGANRAYIQANGKMFADHKYGQSDVVGKIRAYIPVMSGGSQSAWKVRFHLASTDAGMTAAKIIDELGGIGLSVGFFAKDYGPPSAEEKTLYGKGGRPRRRSCGRGIGLSCPPPASRRTRRARLPRSPTTKSTPPRSKNL
jgi:hypothetical protein